MFDEVFWDWYCSLFHQEKPKSEWDPLVFRCDCGKVIRFHKLHYIKMIIFDGITITCSNCQHKHRFKLISHVVREVDDTRIQNNELEKVKDGLWRHG